MLPVLIWSQAIGWSKGRAMITGLNAQYQIAIDLAAESATAEEQGLTYSFADGTLNYVWGESHDTQCNWGGSFEDVDGFGSLCLVEVTAEYRFLTSDGDWDTFESRVGIMTLDEAALLDDEDLAVGWEYVYRRV